METQPNTETTPQQPQVIDQEKLQQLVDMNYLMKAFDRVTAIQCEPGDLLIMQFSNRVPMNARMNMMKNFDAYMRKRGLQGLFIPSDLDFKGVISPPRMEVKSSGNEVQNGLDESVNGDPGDETRK